MVPTAPASPAANPSRPLRRHIGQPMAMLPDPWRPTGRSWNPMASHCYLVELEHPSQPSDYVYRPIDGYVHWYDVVFAAASFARLFDLDPIAVESWLWTGRVMTVEEVLHA